MRIPASEENANDSEGSFLVQFCNSILNISFASEGSSLVIWF